MGGAYAVKPSAFPDELAYVALGHIHRAQQMDHPDVEVRYCGSPLQLDFSEREDAKHVLVAEIEPGAARVRQVPITAGTPLHRVTGRLEDVEEAIDDLSRELGALRREKAKKEPKKAKTNSQP